MAHSDVVVTVSPSHAEELCTAEGGFGLHDRFTALGDRLVGILNGIDPDLWNPETDPDLTGNYSSEDLSGKRRCKAALQRAYGLSQRGHTPLFGMSARMVSQKGLDLVLGADLLGTTEAQFIFLGAGEHRYHEALGNIAAAAPDRDAWRKMVRGAMAQQFGWHRSGELYLALYARALAVRSAALSS